MAPAPAGSGVRSIGERRAASHCLCRPCPLDAGPMGLVRRLRSLLHGVLRPPRGSLSGVAYLELRFVSVTAFVLTILGIVSATAFPLALGFSPIDFAINSTSTL